MQLHVVASFFPLKKNIYINFFKINFSFFFCMIRYIFLFAAFVQVSKNMESCKVSFSYCFENSLYDMED